MPARRLSDCHNEPISNLQFSRHANGWGFDNSSVNPKRNMQGPCKPCKTLTATTMAAVTDDAVKLLRGSEWTLHMPFRVKVIFNSYQVKNSNSLCSAGRNWNTNGYPIIIRNFFALFFKGHQYRYAGPR